MRVSTFTDTYLPTVNGVTYTINLWKERWNSDDRGRMTVTYPNSKDYEPDPDEIPVKSFNFPFYEGYKIALPLLPSESRDSDIVHVHSPFSMGIAGAGLASYKDTPLVASYHTPISKYIDYLTSNKRIAKRLRSVSNYWERKYLGRTDAVIVPSDETKQELMEKGVNASKVHVLGNGVDTDFFEPQAEYDLLSEWGVDSPVIGYCGRHGYEKNLDHIIDAAARLDDELDVVIVGDGPAREDLIDYAEERGLDDVCFPGFLEREKLPSFYSSLDVFAFPSDVETQGLVALEATACGTPVVGADAAGLKESIDDGMNGYKYPVGDIDEFVSMIETALEKNGELSNNCLDMRGSISVENTLEDLESIYGKLV